MTAWPGTVRNRDAAYHVRTARILFQHGESYAVSGILPADFAFAPSIDVWLHSLRVPTPSATITG